MAQNAVNAEKDTTDLENGIQTDPETEFDSGICSWDSAEVVTIVQKVIAEVCGTYFVIFAGCGSVAANKVYGGTVTFPGICITWGLIVMCMIYSVGHISGAHFNPAITVTFAIFRRFPWKQVPFYIAAQVAGSTLASGTVRLVFDVDKDKYFGTVPAGSDIQSFAIEIIIAFLQMFVVCGVATDTRAVGELAGIAVGASVVLNVFVAGPMSGASLNPARSLGPAIVMNVYRGIWVYMVAPFVGSIAGGFVYGWIRITDRPLIEIAKTASMGRGLQ
ncbi:hypothetical protein ACET3Z_006525 [Daucus carota]